MARKVSTSNKNQPVVVQAASPKELAASGSFLNRIIRDGVVAGTRLMVWIPLKGGGNKRVELSALDMTKVPGELSAVIRKMKDVKTSLIPAAA